MAKWKHEKRFILKIQSSSPLRGVTPDAIYWALLDTLSTRTGITDLYCEVQPGDQENLGSSVSEPGDQVALQTAYCPDLSRKLQELDTNWADLCRRVAALEEAHRAKPSG